MIKKWTFEQLIHFTQQANGFIYYLQKLPLIGKRIPDTLFAMAETKKRIGIFVLILSIVWIFLRKYLYFLIMIALPVNWVCARLAEQGIVLSTAAFCIGSFFLQSVLFGSLACCQIFSQSASDYTLLLVLRVNAREHYLGQLMQKMAVETVFFLIVFLLHGLSWKSIPLLLALTGGRWIGSMIAIRSFNRFEKSVYANPKFVFGVGFLLLAILYGLPFLSSSWIGFFETPAFMILLCLIGAAGVPAFSYVWRYKRFTELSHKTVTMGKIIELETVKQNARTADVALDQKQVAEAEKNQQNLFHNKHGYEYLNALFFVRHRKIVKNALRMRMIVTGVILFGIAACTLFIPSIKNPVWNTLCTSSPLLIFIMYLLSTGSVLCKAMFYNCDASLIKYGYYRESSAILKNFTIRIKKVTALNLLPAAEIVLGMTVIALISGRGSELYLLLPNIGIVIILACTFSIFHLFMYYIFQPYSEDMNIKNPFFSVINSAVYILAYACLQIKTSSILFTLFVLIFTICFCVAALIIIYRMAPRTFRIK